jgi:hypothetical protein
VTNGGPRFSYCGMRSSLSEWAQFRAAWTARNPGDNTCPANRHTPRLHQGNADHLARKWQSNHNWEGQDISVPIWHVNCFRWRRWHEVTCEPIESYRGKSLENMRGRSGCELGCGFFCGALRDERSSGADGLPGTNEPSCGSPPAGEHGEPSETLNAASLDLRGWGFVLAATYVFLLPPLILLASAFFLTNLLGEAAAVGAGVIASFLLLVPAHRRLTCRSASLPSSRSCS